MDNDIQEGYMGIPKPQLQAGESYCLCCGGLGGKPTTEQRCTNCDGNGVIPVRRRKIRETVVLPEDGGKSAWPKMGN